VAFTPVSTAQAVKAVLFDVFGTVVDWRAGVAGAVRRFAGEQGLELDAAAFADAWRSRYVPAMRRVSTGQRPFVPLDTALDELTALKRDACRALIRRCSWAIHIE
jgi:2-haloacid dehalogenase